MEPPSPKRNGSDKDDKRDKRDREDDDGPKLRPTTQAVREKRAKMDALRTKISTEDCEIAKEAAEAELRALEKDSDPRSDKNNLLMHLEKSHAHKTKYKRRYEEETTEAGDPIPAHKAKMTEADGELAAALYMATTYRNAKLFSGFASGTGFDQIWVEDDDKGEIKKIIIVEAKGKNAKLSKDAKKGEQMDARWVTNSVLELKKRYQKTDTKNNNNNIADDDAQTDGYQTIEKNKEMVRLMLSALGGERDAPDLIGKVIAIDGDGMTGEENLPTGGDYPKGDSYKGLYNK